MVLGDCLLNVFTVYDPHSGKPDEEKESFWGQSISFGKLLLLHYTRLTALCPGLPG